MKVRQGSVRFTTAQLDLQILPIHLIEHRSLTEIAVKRTVSCRQKHIFSLHEPIFCLSSPENDGAKDRIIPTATIVPKILLFIFLTYQPVYFNTIFQPRIERI